MPCEVISCSAVTLCPQRPHWHTTHNMTMCDVHPLVHVPSCVPRALQQRSCDHYACATCCEGVCPFARDASARRAPRRPRPPGTARHRASRERVCGLVLVGLVRLVCEGQLAILLPCAGGLPPAYIGVDFPCSLGTVAMRSASSWGLVGSHALASASPSAPKSEIR